MRPTVSAKYTSNMAKATKDLDRKLERIVARCAREGALVVRVSSYPPVSAHATGGETTGSLVEAGVFISKAQWWATMFDKGTLGQRRVPLEQPGRRKLTWKISRGGKVYVAKRSPEALVVGGIDPQYFLVRGKRHAEAKLIEYLKRDL